MRLPSVIIVCTGGIMYEQTTSSFISRKSDNNQLGKSSSPQWGSAVLGALSLRMGCPNCDRRRSGLCDCRKTANSNNTTAI